MSGKSKEQIYFEAISQGIARVLGKPISIKKEMRLKSDLDLSSLDVVDVGYELEQITGLPVRLRDVFLAQEAKGISKPQDVFIADILDYLVQLETR